MKFSFTNARKKPLLSKGLKIWLSVVFIIEVIIIFSNTLINSQITNYEQRIESNNMRRDRLDSVLKKLYKKERLIKREAALVKKMRDSNSNRRKKIHQIFELIGPKLTLTKATWQEDGLLLEGFTETKEAFDFALKDKLRKMYGANKTVFFDRPDGGFDFSSKNISNERKVSQPTTLSKEMPNPTIDRINALKNRAKKKYAK